MSMATSRKNELMKLAKQAKQKLNQYNQLSNWYKPKLTKYKS